MALTSPQVIVEAFCATGTLGTDYIIPPQSSGDPTIMTQDVGYPIAQATPLNAGGVFIERNQTNGAFFLYSSHIAWLQFGGTYIFEADVSTANGGYSQNCVLFDTGSKRFVISLINSNTYDYISTPSYIDGVKWQFLDVQGYATAAQTRALTLSTVAVTPSSLGGIFGASRGFVNDNFGWEMQNSLSTTKTTTVLSSKYVSGAISGYTNFSSTVTDGTQEGQVVCGWSDGGDGTPKATALIQSTASANQFAQFITTSSDTPYVGYYSAHLNQITSSKFGRHEFYEKSSTNMFGTFFVTNNGLSGTTSTGFQLEATKRPYIYGTLSDLSSAAGSVAFIDDLSTASATQLAGHQVAMIINNGTNYTVTISGYITQTVASATSLSASVPLSAFGLTASQSTNLGPASITTGVGITSSITGGCSVASSGTTIDISCFWTTSVSTDITIAFNIVFLST